VAKAFSQMFKNNYLVHIDISFCNFK